MSTLKILKLIGKICTIVFVLLSSLGSVVTPIILKDETQSVINNMMGIVTTKKVELEGEDVEPIEYYKTEYDSILNLKEVSHDVSKRVQTEGAVLLKNDNNALPLSSGNSVNLYDVTSVDPIWGGFGSGQAVVTGTSGRNNYGQYNSPDFPYATSRPSFLKSFKAVGLNVNEDLYNWYNNTSGIKRVASSGWPNTQNINGASWSQVSASGYATTPADAGIFILGRIGGEDSDRPLLSWDGDGSGNQTKSYLKLSTKEQETLQQLKALRENNILKKLILIINSSNQPELDWLVDNKYGIDAAVWVGGLGQDGIDGIAKLLVGEENFSGRLPMVFWTNHAKNPVMSNFGGFMFNSGTMRTGSAGDNISDRYVVYQEGMYLGYRYTETIYEDTVMGTPDTGVSEWTFDDAQNKYVAEEKPFVYNDVVAYPFGFGLSYTDFEYSNFNVRKEDFSAMPLIRPTAENKGKTRPKTIYYVTVNVKNVGSVAGKEAVQIYMQRPYNPDMAGKIEIPSVELVGFAKTGVLLPGESQEVTVEVDEKYFAAFDAYENNTFILNPGDYYLTVGKDAHDAVNNILNLKGYSNGMVASRGSSSPAAGNKNLAKKVLTLTGANASKYSISDVTGNEITNLFDSADPKLYEESENQNSFNYVSRNNWKSTLSFINEKLPEAQQTCQVVLKKTQKMTDDMNTNKAPLDPDDGDYPVYGQEPSGGPIMLADLAVRKPDGSMYYDYDDPIWDEFLDQLTWNDYNNLLRSGKRHTEAVETVAKPKTIEVNGPVGFCVQYEDSGKLGTSSNTEKDPGFAGLSRLGVFLDENDEYIPRRARSQQEIAEDPDNLNWYERKYEDLYGEPLEPILDPNRTAYPTAFPSNPVVAATFNKELVEEVGRMIGEDALWAGYSGIYGTGLNIIRSPHAGRAFEYYSEDGFLSGEIAAAWTAGCQSKGMYVYNKHFALNDQEYSRKGVATFLNEQTFREIYLRAFEIPIVKADARAMMGAYNRIGVTFAPATKALFTDWLRGETGFSGFTVTDWWSSDSESYYMQLPRTLIAGNNLPDGVLGASVLNRYHPETGSIKNSELAWAMRESAKRIMFTVADSNAMNGMSTNTRIVSVDVAWPKMVEAAQTTLYVLAGVSSALFIGSIIGLAILKKRIFV